MSEGRALELILQSIPWTQNFNSVFRTTRGDKVITLETPVYAVPGKKIDQKLQIGTYLPSGELGYVPVGLIQTRNFNTSYYHYLNGNWVIAPRKQKDLTYLPLERLFQQMDIHHQGKPLKIHPHNLYSLRGLEHPFPFIILEEESEDGLVKHIPYQNGQKEISWHQEIIKNDDEDPWFDYLEQLENGTYTNIVLKNAEQRIKITTAARKIVSPAVKTPSLDLKSTEIDWTDPISINQSLDTVVESQPDAKKVFSVGVSQYITGAMNGALHLHPVFLLIGPTGVGKTLMASHIAEKTTLPKAIADLQLQSGQGYVGGNITDVFQLIHRQTKEEAPFGYVLYNELDKLAVDDLNSWGRQLQYELLSVLEKGQVQIPDEENKFFGSNNKNWFTTKNLFFAFTGAFVGLEDVIAKRLGLEKRIGFGVQHRAAVNKYGLLKQASTEDLINYGLIPELVGRITSITVLDALSKKDLTNILSKPAMSPITGHKKQLQQRGYTLEVEEQAYDSIAKACPQETGARALKGICGKLFTDIEYNPKQFVKGADKTIYLTPTLVEELLAGKYK